MTNNSKAKYLYNLPEHKSVGRINPALLRIIITPAYTKIDFGYQTIRYYEKGGWVRISKDTFIRIKATGEKFTMTKSENIPVAPVRHNFKSTKDWLYFSLYFPPMPPKTKWIDIIEAEPGTPNDFNYHDIELNSKKAMELL
mgnify:CR=1 FL=1